MLIHVTTFLIEANNSKYVHHIWPSVDAISI